MRYNLYYNDKNGNRENVLDMPMRAILTLVQVMLESGGEITGIIAVEKD